MLLQQESFSSRCLSRASTLLLAVLSFACVISPTTTQAFTVGTNYDAMLNAFVYGLDLEPAIEGHFSSMSIMDGKDDQLPLNFPVPMDLPGSDLVTSESVDSIAGRPRVDSTISISAANGGPIVTNRLLEGGFGRVTMMLSRLQIDLEQGQVAEARVFLTGSDGIRRESNEDIYITGAGSSSDPWRVITSIQGDEFGQDTERVDFTFQVVPEPSGICLALTSLLGISLLRRQRFV